MILFSLNAELVPERVTSRRFSQEYNADLKQWGKFWQENEVPQTKNSKELKARLANIFRIGAGRTSSNKNMFEPNMESLLSHFHSRHDKDIIPLKNSIDLRHCHLHWHTRLFKAFEQIDKQSSAACQRLNADDPKSSCKHAEASYLLGFPTAVD